MNNTSRPNAQTRLLTHEQSYRRAEAYIKKHPNRFLIPLRPGSKETWLKDWPHAASNDLRDIERWATDFKAIGPDWACAGWKSCLLNMDMDTKTKNGVKKIGAQTFAALVERFPELADETEMVRTPSGGIHRIFEGHHIFKVNGFGTDIDSPGYWPIPGTEVFRDDDEGDGLVGVYETINEGVSALKAHPFFYTSEFLGVPELETVNGVIRPKRRAATAENPGEARDPLIELDQPSNVERAVEIAKAAAPAVQGKTGDNNTYKVVQWLKDQGLSPHKVFEVLSEHWNPRCQPPWDQGGLMKKIANAYKYGQNRPGSATAEAQFAGDEVDIDSIQTEGSPEEIAEQLAARAEHDRLRRLRALRNVRALRDKTVANGCTEEEAASAQAKAGELVTLYKLTDEELAGELPPDSAEEEQAARGKDMPSGARMKDFWHYGPTNAYIYVKTNDMWQSGSINVKFGAKATAAIAKFQSVEQVTWAPGHPQIVRDRLIQNGVFEESPGNRVYNQYRPQTISDKGDAAKADPWLDHLKLIYPDDWEHIIGWMAWRVQKPDVKINRTHPTSAVLCDAW